MPENSIGGTHSSPSLTARDRQNYADPNPAKENRIESSFVKFFEGGNLNFPQSLAVTMQLKKCLTADARRCTQMRRGGKDRKWVKRLKR
jgi:hypothetical protein